MELASPLVRVALADAAASLLVVVDVRERLEPAVDRVDLLLVFFVVLPVLLPAAAVVDVLRLRVPLPADLRVDALAVFPAALEVFLPVLDALAPLALWRLLVLDLRVVDFFLATRTLPRPGGRSRATAGLVTPPCGPGGPLRDGDFASRSPDGPIESREVYPQAPAMARTAASTKL
ncbi:MAG: hypothetical protein ACODAQ_05005 [Phycisphaeraceae bacterium]